MPKRRTYGGVAGGIRGTLGSLGADEPELTDAQFRAALLQKQDAVIAGQKEMVEWQSRWVKRDELQRWMQIAATLSIPLAAAVWRMIFKAGRKSGKKRR